MDIKMAIRLKDVAEFDAIREFLGDIESGPVPEMGLAALCREFNVTLGEPAANPE